MHKKKCLLCLSAVLILGIFSGTGSGLAKDEIHLYQEIPMEGATPEIVSQILLEKTGVPFDVSEVVWSGTADGIVDFGYEWNLQLDFEEDYRNINRILLSSAQAARVAPEEFDERVESDFLQFINVENQLIQAYGEPDCRFFFTNNDQNKTTRYMFQSGTWNIGQMVGVFEKKHVFVPYSIWGNVVLKAWVNEQDTNIEGKPLTRIMLYYYPNMQTTSAMTTSSVIQYPSANDD